MLESEMIDAIFQAKTMRDYWMTLATERVAVECEIERYWVEQSGKRTERRIDGSESARSSPGSEEIDSSNTPFLILRLLKAHSVLETTHKNTSFSIPSRQRTSQRYPTPPTFP